MANPKNDEFNVKLLEEILIEHFQDKVKFVNDNGRIIDVSTVFSECGFMPLILAEAEDFSTSYFNLPISYYDWFEEPRGTLDTDEKDKLENQKPEMLFGQIARIITRLNGFQIYIIILIAELMLNIDDNFNPKDGIKTINLDNIIKYYSDENFNQSTYNGGERIFSLNDFTQE